MVFEYGHCIVMRALGMALSKYFAWFFLYISVLYRFFVASPSFQHCLLLTPVLALLLLINQLTSVSSTSWGLRPRLTLFWVRVGLANGCGKLVGL
jgi:hypothetical protein